MIEKPLLTFPSVKHAIVKDGVVQHQVMQRWALGTHGDTNHAKSETQKIFAVHSFISLLVTPYIQQITILSDLKRVKILSGANKSFKKLVIMF